MIATPGAEPAGTRNSRRVMLKTLLCKALRAPQTVFRVVVDRLIGPSYLRWQGVSFGPGLVLAGLPVVSTQRADQVVLGKRVHLMSRSRSNPLYLQVPCALTVLNREARIQIGDDCGLSGVVICSGQSIGIGARTLIGANTRILDTDFHPLLPEARRADRNRGAKSEPVVIGNDVFIGTDVIILRGTVLGDGCVVGAGSVVAGSFPARTILAGNPARAIRTI
jgi:acetyltransferase-like isoleucine patch superfamily enzyme